ncbi:MAG: hypothetical protein LBR79_04665 [Oscillospiraceae bacterium]|nr:hypothetical protein [Oscillospiraceae bacterium]
MAFGLSLVLLVLGILLAGVVVYDCAMIYERLRQAHYKEVESALNECREVSPILIHERKRTIICERISLLLLIMGVIMLTAYKITLIFLSS